MALFEVFATPQAWLALATLSAMEIVLGIDNLVFLSILANKLPEGERVRARRIGLGLALGMRILLLLSISWVMGLTAPLFSVLGASVSGRDLVLGVGGLFLIAKATHEIFGAMEGATKEEGAPAKRASFTWVLVQIALLDIVFSLDSVITAVGMAKDIIVMVIAVVLAIIAMMVFADQVGAFIERHPSMKLLALSFLILIGVMLVAESFGQHIDKGYIYFAMGFSLSVQLLNIRLAKRAAPA